MLSISRIINKPEWIFVYDIWMKIEKEYVDNYEVECELLKQHLFLFFNYICQ